jgi:hypothetical protein
MANEQSGQSGQSVAAGAAAGASGRANKDDEKESKRRLMEKDWKLAETRIKDELEKRKKSEFRLKHESMWKEVDRQVLLQPMARVNRDQSDDNTNWHNVFELGELSRASELVSADIRRIIFPHNRSWLESHCEIKWPLDPQTGKPVKNPAVQKSVDGNLRALITQQLMDFGFKERVDLSIKEALHHGSFVAEVRPETMTMIYEGTKVREVTAPVWVPYSMWNCYPDPSPSIIGANMFYSGSMIIEDYIPRHKLKEAMSGEGWMPERFKKIPLDEHHVKENRTKDIKLTKFWGDIVFERTKDDIYYPNHKVILANGVLVYFAPFDLPYPEIIYSGYEKMDVRDPYYISPIIKFSPMQKMTTVLGNKVVDAIEMDLEPPLIYDGNDADMVSSNGPPTWPGAKIAAKTAYETKFLESADPNPAITAFQFCINYMRENLAKPGADVGDRATAEEVLKKEADSEVGEIGFIDKFESAIRSYLYMHHDINKREMSDYSYYNRELDEPDFVRVSRKDLPQSVHFELIGAKGILGERARQQAMAGITINAAKSPLFGPLLKAREILIQLYQDAGVKNPETFVKSPQEMPLPPQIMLQMQQMQMIIRKLVEELKKEKSGNEVKLEGIHKKHEASLAKIMADIEIAMAELGHKEKSEAMSFMAEMMRTAVLENKQEKPVAPAAPAEPPDKTPIQ